MTDTSEDTTARSPTDPSTTDRQTPTGDPATTGDNGAPDFAPDTLLSVRDLSTRFHTNEGQVNAVESLSFDLKRGEVLGIVGESGSGKSVTGLSIMNLVDGPGRIAGGEIWLRAPRLAEAHRAPRPGAVHGEFVDLRRLPDEAWNSLRGSSFSMIFQDPMSGFSPTNTVGDQIAEAVEVNRRAASAAESGDDAGRDYGLPSLVAGAFLRSKRYVTDASRDRAVDLLDRVGIPDPKNRAREYPHQFSGGMLQRAMIAQALAGEPDLLIADEPTTALDVTIQAQILSLLDELQTETNMSVIFITHNINVLSHVADRIGVMYAGEIVERGTPAEIFEAHVHPYTAGLLGSIPEVAEGHDAGARLTPIPGNVPSLLDHEMADECYFADRCPKAMDECLTKPAEYEVSDGHGVKCYLADREYDPARALDGEARNASDGGDGTGEADGGERA